MPGEWRIRRMNWRRLMERHQMRSVVFTAHCDFVTIPPRSNLTPSSGTLVDTAKAAPLSLTIKYGGQQRLGQFTQGSRFYDVKRFAVIAFQLEHVPLNRIKLYDDADGAVISPEKITHSTTVTLVILPGPSVAIVPKSPLAGRPRWMKPIDPNTQEHTLKEILAPNTVLVAFLDTNILIYLECLKTIHCVRCQGNLPTAKLNQTELTSLVNAANRGSVLLCVSETVVREVKKHFGDGTTILNQYRCNVVQSGIPWQAKDPIVKHIGETMGVKELDDNTVNDIKIFLEAGLVSVQTNIEVALISNNMVLIAMLKNSKSAIVNLVHEYGISTWLPVTNIANVNFDNL